jgi:hypothetical protein
VSAPARLSGQHVQNFLRIDIPRILRESVSAFGLPSQARASSREFPLSAALKALIYGGDIDLQRVACSCRPCAAEGRRSLQLRSPVRGPEGAGPLRFRDHDRGRPCSVRL